MIIAKYEEKLIESILFYPLLSYFIWIFLVIQVLINNFFRSSRVQLLVFSVKDIDSTKINFWLGKNAKKTGLRDLFTTNWSSRRRISLFHRQNSWLIAFFATKCFNFFFKASFRYFFRNKNYACTVCERVHSRLSIFSIFFSQIASIFFKLYFIRLVLFLKWAETDCFGFFFYLFSK